MKRDELAEEDAAIERFRRRIAALAERRPTDPRYDRPPAMTGAERQRRMVERRRNMTAPAEVHGTPSGYTDWACREACCREAWRIDQNERNSRRRQPNAA